jgi:hypothetical protein
VSSVLALANSLMAVAATSANRAGCTTVGLGGQVIRTVGGILSGLLRSTWMVSLDPLMAPLANGVMGEDRSTAGSFPVEAWGALTTRTRVATRGHERLQQLGSGHGACQYGRPLS